VAEDTHFNGKAELAIKIKIGHFLANLSGSLDLAGKHGFKHLPEQNYEITHILL
jgi:hypothetical protein